MHLRTNSAGFCSVPIKHPSSSLFHSPADHAATGFPLSLSLSPCRRWSPSQERSPSMLRAAGARPPAHAPRPVTSNDDPLQRLVPPLAQPGPRRLVRIRIKRRSKEEARSRGAPAEVEGSWQDLSPWSFRWIGSSIGLNLKAFQRLARPSHQSLQFSGSKGCERSVWVREAF